MPIGQLSHMADVSSMISYTHIISEQSNTHAAYTMDIVDIHLHTTVYLFITVNNLNTAYRKDNWNNVPLHIKEREWGFHVFLSDLNTSRS